MPVSLGDLKDRKLVQWAVAYAAAAWLVMQGAIRDEPRFAALTDRERGRVF
jgi:hypothetical protein